ncbi:MAG TPA: DUF4089 domain-containing protein [Hyphomicrobium sp.]|nr:DUF4089 domain-containing protein [Hyphomicrobium sp.]
MTKNETMALIDAAAANLGLAIAPEWKPNVAMFFEVACGMAKMIENTGATTSAEAAPVFTPSANSPTAE